MARRQPYTPMNFTVGATRASRIRMRSASVRTPPSTAIFLYPITVPRAVYRHAPSTQASMAKRSTRWLSRICSFSTTRWMHWGCCQRRMISAVPSSFAGM